MSGAAAATGGALAGSLLEHFSDLPAPWRAVFAAAPGPAALQALARRVDARTAAGAVVYPAQPLVALQAIEPQGVRVVVLGQDPYHGPGQAHGLAFSVPDGVALPPSLRNIFQELARDTGGAVRRNGNLAGWARQGVLLLNTALTVEQGQPASHAGCGWEALTDAVVGAIARQAGPRAFLLWGAHAHSKRALIEAGSGPRLVLQANHPSPLSARRPPVPFIGCGHFSRANDFLVAHGAAPIDWDS